MKQVLIKKMIMNVLTNPRTRFNLKNSIGIYDLLSDEAFQKKKFKAITGYDINFDSPKSLNEKLQWLMLFDRTPLHTQLADKYLVREYIKRKIGESYLIPLLGVWDSPDEIDFNNLPARFVIKCNHNSGKGMYICRDKNRMNEKKVRASLKRGIKQNYYMHAREWPYKDIPRKIIAETLLENDDGTPIADYKFYCYGGKPRYFMVSYGEAEHNVRNHKFNLEGKSIDYLFKEKATVSVDEICLPENLDQMIELVQKLCTNFQHVRVDLYNVEGRIYFGEMTFFSGAGYINMISEDFSNEMAGYINLDAVIKQR